MHGSVHWVVHGMVHGCMGLGLVRFDLGIGKVWLMMVRRCLVWYQDVTYKNFKSKPRFARDRIKVPILWHFVLDQGYRD